MTEKSILMAAGFAIAIMVAVELTLLPASIHDAQANPFSENVVGSSVYEVDIDCEFYGPVEIYEHPGNEVPMDVLPLPTQ
ncbi:MAG TPA: hypothetical protein VLR10_01020 [Nitrososphaeraceae archaeon]|nr:hypothetical protein [Nitrososphaeraceae archaeon]